VIRATYHRTYSNNHVQDVGDDKAALLWAHPEFALKGGSEENVDISTIIC